MRKKLLFSFMCLAFSVGYVLAQERTVSGNVTADKDGTTLPGVNVVVKGTSIGTVTDLSGNYTLTIPADATVLVFSFIGLTTQEVTIGDRTVVDVNMQEDSQQLEEVVVTSMGIEREKRALGYAVQEVKNEELTKTHQNNILGSLQGKVSGVQISNAGGGLGSSTRVVLRGPSSLLGNNQALFVVDGVPINNSSSSNVQASGNFYDNVVDGGNRANDINPEDVASVSILKGPTAAALYGSRAANGVILITTKKGSKAKQKTEVTYNSSFLWSQVYIFPRLQNRFGQGQYGNNQDYLDDQESWGDPFDGSLRPYGSIVNNQQRYKRYVGQPDNIKDFYNIGKTFQNSLSLSGGNQTSSYYMSFADMAQTGVIPTTDYHRNNFSVNGSTTLANKLSSTASINYVKIKANLPQSGQGNQAITQILNMPRDYSYVDMRNLSNPFNTPDGFFTPYAVNPYYSLKHDYAQQDLNRIYGNFTLFYDVFSWMSIKARVGTDVVYDRRNTFADIITYEDEDGANYDQGSNTDGEYTEQQISTREINADLMVTLTHNFNESIEGSLLLGYNFNQRGAKNVYATASSLVVPGFDNLANVDGTYSAVGTTSLRRIFGLYGSLDLSYNGYLFFNAGYRNDWSSTLPEQNNSFSYPGVSVSFVPTDAFDMNTSVLSYGKIRLGYAEAGNDASPYETRSVFTQALGGSFDYLTNDFAVIDFPFNNGSVTLPGFTQANTIGNANLQPEITKSLEAGIEVRLFENRVFGDFTYYYNVSQSQILSATVAPSSGYRTQVLNIGKMTNRGVEITLGGTILNVAGVKWDMTLNFTKNVNRVEELNDGASELILIAQDLTPGLKIVKGKPYGVFEVTPVLRTDEGKIVVDSDGLPQNGDPVYKGSVQPKWMGGLTSTASYKGISLSVTLDTKQGGNVVSTTMAQLYFNGQAEETAFNDREPWIVPNSVKEVVVGDDITYEPNDIPLTMYDDGTIRDYWSNVQGGDINERVLLDASYIKLREVALNYDLPKHLLANTPFGHITIGAIGRNLWLHTAKDNHMIDPEANNFGAGNMSGYRNLVGYEFYGVPPQASYGFNLRATF